MDIKYLFKEQIILTVLIIFVVLYFIVNFNNIYSGSMFSTNNNIRKPLLLALIISLLGYLFVTWDNNSFSEEIPKYKIVNNRNNIISLLVVKIKSIFTHAIRPQPVTGKIINLNFFKKFCIIDT